MPTQNLIAKGKVVNAHLKVPHYICKIMYFLKSITYYRLFLGIKFVPLQQNIRNHVL